MRYQELFEAPISDIQTTNDTGGSFQHGTAFDKKESNFLSSPAYQGRIKDAFKKTPFDFEIIFINHKGHDAEDPEDNLMFQTEIGGKSYGNNTIDSSLGITYEWNGIRGKPGKIIVVMIGNLSPDNRIPITPWILAHKIGHGVIDTNGLTKYAEAIYNEVIKLIPDHPKDPHEHIRRRKMIPLVVKLLTMKSARNEQLSDGTGNIDEIVVELIAQYLIRGSVKFNAPDSENTVKTVNAIIDSLLQKAVGKVIVEM